MSSKKQKAKDKFPNELIREWENSDGVNFAIALTRASDWLLHVDWWARTQNDTEDQTKSLWVYVGTDTDALYDFNGKKLALACNLHTIQPLLLKRKLSGGGVASRYYSEEKPWTLPLQVRSSEARIARAEESLRKYPAVLAKMPPRLSRRPAHIAATRSLLP